MYKTGHYGAALLLYAPVGYLLLSVDPALAVLGGVGSVALARIPDYDIWIPFVKHRGITHTLLFLIAVAVVLGAMGHTFAPRFGTDPVRTAGLGVIVATVAVGSHLLADLLTPAGAPLLWPISSESYSVDLTTSSDPIANYGLLALGIAVTAGVGYVSGLV
jgi:inner membrane protein